MNSENNFDQEEPFLNSVQKGTVDITKSCQPYYIVLGSGCEYQKRDCRGRYRLTGKFKGIDIPFKFATEELYDYYDGYDFRHIPHVFNDAIQLFDKGYFTRDDCIEPVRDISEKDALNNYPLVCIINDFPDKYGEIDVSYWQKGMGVKSSKG